MESGSFRESINVSGHNIMAPGNTVVAEALNSYATTPKLLDQLRGTCFGTRLQHTYSRRARTFGPSKNFLAIET